MLPKRISELKKVYEEAFGAEISASTWRLIRKVIAAHNIDEAGVAFYAKLRKTYPRMPTTAQSYADVMRLYEVLQKEIIFKQVLGGQVRTILKAHNIEPAAPTFYRWFTDCDLSFGYNCLFTKEEIKPILLRGAIWRVKTNPRIKTKRR